MTLLRRLKQAAITALATITLYSGASAQDAPKPERTPVKTETLIYTETRQDPAVQTLVSYYGQKVVAEVGQDTALLGVDLKYDKFRLNAGWRDTLTKDQGKAYLSYN